MSQVPFVAVVAASTLADALVAGLFLFAPRREGVLGVRQVGLAILATGLAFVGKVAILTGMGLHGFGLIHLVYADAVVMVPLLGLAILVASRLSPRRRATFPVRLAAWASLGLAGVGVYATEIEPFRLQVETASATVNPAREGKDPVRIGILTDLQTTRVTDYERGAIDRLMALKPDLILLPGDIFQDTHEAFERELPALRELLGRLSAPGGVFLVQGDVDQPAARLAKIAEGTNIIPLHNRVETVTIGDRRVTIGGVELRYDRPDALRVASRLETEEGDGDIRILLSHRPDSALGLEPGSRIDLVAAGHTHGGQIVIPFFGPPVTLSRVPRAVAAGGLHAIAGNAIYVGRGVGCERAQAPRIRFLCPPEIALLTLEGRR